MFITKPSTLTIRKANKMEKILVSSPRFWAKVKGHDLHKRNTRSIAYLSLNQSPKCNYNCQRCFRYPERKNMDFPNLLSMRDYNLLLTDFCCVGGLAIEISGEGEPLLSPNTLPIINYASKMGLWTTLITNGHYLTKEMLYKLKKCKVALVISLHTLNKNKYEADCGLPGSYEIKMKNIALASQIFRDTSWQEKGYEIFKIAIHWTLQADNLKEIEKVRQFCHENHLFFSIAPLAKVGNALNNPEIWLPENLEKIDTINESGDNSIIFYDEPDGRKVCGTCKYGLNIGCNGEILLDAHGGYEARIANIRDIRLRKAVDLQHEFSDKMFSELNSFCPIRDPGWKKFIEKYS